MNSCTRNAARLAPTSAANAMAPAMPVRSWYRSSPREQAAFTRGGRIECAKFCMRFTELVGSSAAILLAADSKTSHTYWSKGSSAFASMFIARRPFASSPTAATSALRGSPRRSSNGTRCSGVALVIVTFCVSARELSSASSSGGMHGPPPSGHQARAHSNALRPGTHCSLPPFGGARANHCSTVRIFESFFVIITFVRL